MSLLATVIFTAVLLIAALLINAFFPVSLAIFFAGAFLAVFPAIFLAVFFATVFCAQTPDAACVALTRRAYARL